MSQRKGKCTFCFCPTLFTSRKTKRAFPFPLFAHAKKRINFPQLSCIFTNRIESTAYNMGFARCGVEGNPRKFLENTRKKLFHFLVFS
ncbi:hypothetical protein [Amniculibacterium aquaticum]|uniref:hypothetical protein n=1 Tax=Amniculibacterium aquaticum TaxID=2479858 RepID=UPI000F5ADB5F|nr:hypothetical protein [Amniculibacterium aquaticum]